MDRNLPGRWGRCLMANPLDRRRGSEERHAVLDLDAYNRLVEEADDDEGRAIMGRVVASYCSGQLLSEARHGFDTGDWELLERSAHNLKGLSYTIGTLAVAAVAGALEQAAERRESPECERLLARLGAALDRAYEALESTSLYDQSLVDELRSARERPGSDA